MIDQATKLNPPGYPLAKGTKTITETINKKLHPKLFEQENAGTDAHAADHGSLLTPEQAAKMAKTMLAIFLIVVFLWGTETLPLGATNILVAVLIYIFGILPLEEISKAFMKDAVFFIFGILVVAVGVSKTGLDKRIGLILLSRIKSAKAFAFIFYNSKYISVRV